LRPRQRRTPSRNSSAERSEPLSKLGRVVHTSNVLCRLLYSSTVHT
jgi:hypothetical protein